MQLFRDLDDLPDSLLGGAVAIGNFDGVHRGHARIVERLLASAARVKGPAIILTFDPHPVRLLRPQEAPPPLTWTDRKAELLGSLGVDGMISYRTDDELLALEPRLFFDSIICRGLAARALVEGPNFYFGHKRAGSIETLRRYCDEHAILLEIVEPLLDRGQYVSSSRVRQLISEGKAGEARSLLTRPYRIRGMVTHGDSRGSKIGFPTANLNAIDTLLPAQGVYAGRAKAEHRMWAAAVNIGPNPTFGQQSIKVEVHLLGFQGSLYGTVLEVDLLDRLRDIRPFNSVDELQEQLARDVEATRALAATME